MKLKDMSIPTITLKTGDQISMTKLETTRTTASRRFVSPDLFRDNESLVLDRARLPAGSPVPPVGAISFESKEPSLPRDMTLLFKSAAVAAQDWLSSCSALVGYRLGLFLAHGPWQPDG
jgi:hypothetical protein